MQKIKIQKEVGEKSGEKSAEKPKKKKIEYEQYTLEELQKRFEKEQNLDNLDELNKIVSAISDKHDVLSDENEETNNVQLEEEIYPQMNLI